jgi:hypothetical protein
MFSVFWLRGGTLRMSYVRQKLLATVPNSEHTRYSKPSYSLNPICPKYVFQNSELPYADSGYLHTSYTLSWADTI